MTNFLSAKLKHTLSILLAGCMLLSFTACGDDAPEEPSEPAVPDTPAVEEPEAPKGDPITPPNISQKMKDAYANNSDTIGWLTVPNTTIDNSVLQTTDNVYYYRLDENRNYSFPGVFWADYENTFGERDMLSSNTIIYGHNINTNDDKNGVRFSQLFHYVDKEFAKANPYVFFSTLEEENMAFQIFSTAYTTTAFHYIEVENMSSLQFNNFLNEVKLRSEYSFPDVDVNSNDKVIVLSTCSYKLGYPNDDTRFIVVGKLVPKDAALTTTENVFDNVNKRTDM